MHDSMKLYTGPPKFEFGRVKFASGGPGGPPVSEVNVEPCRTTFLQFSLNIFMCIMYSKQIGNKLSNLQTPSPFYSPSRRPNHSIWTPF